MEEEEKYWEKWKSYSRCQKNLKPSCEECLDVERCKRDHKFYMLEYQLERKREGQISAEFDAWFEQELKTIDLESIPLENLKLALYKLEMDTFKICLVASKKVGKKTFLRNLANISNKMKNQKIDPMMTIGVEFRTRVVEMNGIKKYLKFFVATDEENRFKYLYRKYIADSNGVILMYDITNAETLNKLSEWYLFIKEKLDHDPPILLVGNKLDLEERREVSKEHVEKFKEKHKLTLSMEISLKTGENVEEMFMNIIKMISASQF